MRRVGLGRRLCVCVCFVQIFLLHCCLLRQLPVVDPDLQRVGRSVCPVASSRAINEATHIEWLHKKGIVEGLSLSSSDRESLEQAARRFRPKSLVA
jgi:hypothetical protein